ncbi:SDR family NAD(P)-dependent oxidoreductase [Streptomyces caniscabiei]|uniref:SDR family NAD(P)-dependent oxidoreductase n=1 Tax=Streptomyces caniscabiei TaxID=2746961 RepID=UPI0029A93FF0|nr:SDR family NAD(P)-dependent oxidoreductase [Streptomyces caniscabiei]MDX3727375.1 SDR family NAD(P)-dependent oxidoreductase [Streptomyces caniscabiei]
MALITGADSGIGRAVALLYAREGADVAIVHLPEETVDADQVRGEVEREGRPACCCPATSRIRRSAARPSSGPWPNWAG